MKVNKKEIKDSNFQTQDGESSNASQQLNTSLLHSPEIHSSVGSSYTPRSSHLFTQQDLEEEPVFSQFTGFSAPIWNFDDALKLIQDRSGTGKRVKCLSCGRERLLPQGIVMMICPSCQEEMK